MPGHMAAGTPLDASAIHYPRDCLQRFDGEAAKAKNAAEVIAAMQKAYPNAGLACSLSPIAVAGGGLAIHKQCQ